jgi:hypothetical protein
MGRRMDTVQITYTHVSNAKMILAAVVPIIRGG